MKRNYTNILLAGGLILLAVVARIVNHEMDIYNLAPVAAIGLFAGSVLEDKRFAYLLPLLAMFISDAYIEIFSKWDGFYGISQYFVYGGLIIATLLGTTMKNRKPLRIAGYSIAGSAIFFVLSNFGTFLTGYWGTGIEGLTATYIAAIPFAKNTFLGDLMFSGMLFGAFALLENALYGKMQKAKA
ncbi:MAG: hypothetical protein H6551_05110 [Chitinophagales bacterium]|nr:hypothetical protein [Chitinophagales bacterium]